MIKSRSQNNTFYTLLGALSVIGFISLSYIILRNDSSLGILYVVKSPTYLYLYLLITLVSALFFGINAVLFTHQWRKYGLKNLAKHSGSGFSGLLGIIAASCPVCGSAFLSFLTAFTGLTLLSTMGLEIRIFALILIIISTFFAYKALNKADCTNESCPMPLKTTKIKNFTTVITLMVIICLAFVFTDLKLWSTDPLMNIYNGETDYTLNSCTSH